MKKTRCPYFFSYFFTALLIIQSYSCSTDKNKKSPPNLIVFIADDVSWDDLGCYGNEYVQSPNIDLLAKDGIVFKNAYLTTSSCSPSRNSIITGRYPHNTGAAELHSMPPIDMISLPEILKSKGYFTLQAGKFHMGDYALRGFDEVHDDRIINGKGGEEYWEEAIENTTNDQPFFMWLASYDAHRAWGENQFTGTHKVNEIKVPEYLIDGPETRLDLVNYYDEITRFDYYIGEVVKKLKEKGVFENTVIVIMADNGRPFPHSKTRVNHQGVKTPFIVHYPKEISTRNTVNESLVSAVDIAPTLIDLAGIDPIDRFQGVSFKKLLLGATDRFRNYVFAEHNWHDYEAYERMVSSKNYMYIKNERPQFAQRGPLDAVNSPTYTELKKALKDGLITERQADIFLAPRPNEELYDLINDPYQFNNLMLGSKIPKIYFTLKQKLEEWSIATGDNLPENLTKDWYLREPVKNTNEMKTKTSNKAEKYSIRGEMPGFANDATRINEKGPF
jgi:arylsulfatase A-like enzyme